MINDDISNAPIHLHKDIMEMKKRLSDQIIYSKFKSVSINGARCALLLDRWLGGLHHMPREQNLYKTDWSGRYVEVVSGSFAGGLSTFDNGGLTSLVLLAHEHCVRVEIGPARASKISIMIHPRSINSDGFSSRHDSLSKLSERIDRIAETCSRHGTQL